MSRCCTRCHGSGIEPAISDLELAAMAYGLREACRALGGMVTADERTDEKSAAALLGLAPKTLSNWRHTSCPIVFVKRKGRVLYAFMDLARWNHESSASLGTAA